MIRRWHEGEIGVGLWWPYWARCVDIRGESQGIVRPGRSARSTILVQRSSVRSRSASNTLSRIAFVRDFQ